MTVQTFTTASAEETIALGRRLAAMLSPPRMVLLQGDLGAGKTTLVKGIAEGMKAAEAEYVTSPTFTLVHEHHGEAATIYHVDLYRIETEKELATLGLDDLRQPNALLLIEWGEKFPALLPQWDARILLKPLSEQSRSVEVHT